MYDRYLVLDYGLNEILLYRLNVAELCPFPLVAVVHPVVSVRVNVDADLPVIVAPSLV